MRQAVQKISFWNLKIITDSRIGSITCKGPKYRFILPIDFKSCHEEIAGSLQEFCNRWCKREHVQSNALNSWKLNIFKIIDDRISFYRNNLDLMPPKPKFTFRHVKKGIQELHRRFVLAPADKAANNVVVVWKRYYINTLKQEVSTAKTYEHNRLDQTSIIDRHRCHMAASFEVFVDEGHSKLPTIYWFPKLYKRPYKPCFIANSSSCTTTELPILLSSCLIEIRNHVIKYCTTVYERNGKKIFWSIKIQVKFLIN